jgi:tripartite-type tricarboxylate transporter receptor subunit TctC
MMSLSGITKTAMALMALAVTAAPLHQAHAQDYPTKPVRILASTAGGGTDFAARVLSQGLAPGMGQAIVVENRPAFNSIDGVAKAAPDGYTLLVMGIPVWLAPFLQDNVPWDPVRDFQPVTTLTRQVTILVVQSSLPINSIKDLIDYAKAKPGQLNYGSGGTGTSSHLSGELFKSMAGTDIVRINYKGAADALTALLGGQIQVMFGNPSSAATHVKSGRVRALAVSSAQPSSLYPGLPPVASVLPGYELVEILGLLAPSRTPMPIVNRWNQAAGKLLNSPELKEKFLASGSEVATGTPEAFAAAINSDMTKFGKVIREARLLEK